MLAPDYAEVVSAWRMWQVVRIKGEPQLVSLFLGTAWPRLDALEADCRALRSVWRRERHRHSAPRSSCACGIYGVPVQRLDAKLLKPFGRFRPLVILGRVSLWGTVVESANGWRASLAYPARLFVPALVERDEERAQELADELANYGVPVDVVSAAGALKPRMAVLDSLASLAA
jgi:hypothetical protein